jgi:hypothetical protein
MSCGGKAALDRRRDLAHGGPDVKAKPRQGRGSQGCMSVWRLHAPLNRRPRQPPLNRGRDGCARTPCWSHGDRAMTRVYNSLSIGSLSGDNAAAQLQRLAERCGVSDADLAALPDAPRRRIHDHMHSGSTGSRVRARRHHGRDYHDSDARLSRRRRWAASGYLPPQIAARFTLAEQSVLSVISKQHMEHGRCALCIGAIAARAGVGRTTVQNALRVARRLGLASVQERRYRGRKSETNVVMIVSKEWTSWLARRARNAGARDAASSRSGSVIACPALDTGRSSVPRAMAQESAHSIQKPEPVESTSKKEGGFSR